jgi:hypothetical protein
MSSPLYVQLGAVKVSLDIKPPELGSVVYAIFEVPGHSVTVDASELLVALPALIRMSGLNPATIP